MSKNATSDFATGRATSKRIVDRRYGGLVSRCGPLRKIGTALVDHATRTKKSELESKRTGKLMIDMSVFKDTPIGVISVVGGYMEDATDLLKAANEEVEESKRVLEDLSNKVRALSGDVYPELVKQVKAIREMRMSATREINLIMNDLKDIRKFFLEKDYETEMQRLERLVELCGKLRDLKADGTLDAVLDSSLRLALEEGKP